MRRFIAILILLTASIWLGLQISADPGLAYFSYKQWSMEMPLWFALTALLFFILFLYLIWHFFISMDVSYYRIKNWLRWQRQHKSYNKTSRGLLELIEGRWKMGEYYLKEGATKSDAPLINYLAAAKAMHELKAYEKRDHYIHLAHLSAPKADIPIGITQAQLQINQGQLEQALATLNHLRSISPRHPLILTLLERLYTRLADWKNLLKLTPDLYKARVITREQLQGLDSRIYQELLKANSITFKQIPKKFQKNPSLIYYYAKPLMDNPELTDTLENQLKSSLKLQWDENLILLYGLLKTAQPAKQLATAEGLLKRYKNQASLFLTLARLCIRCQLWGKARSYFEESITLSPTRGTYLEYGKLLEKLEDKESALENYREGLLLLN